jgi:hypothetical protein
MICDGKYILFAAQPEKASVKAFYSTQIRTGRKC